MSRKNKLSKKSLVSELDQSTDLSAANLVEMNTDEEAGDVKYASADEFDMDALASNLMAMREKIIKDELLLENSIPVSALDPDFADKIDAVMTRLLVIGICLITFGGILMNFVGNWLPWAVIGSGIVLCMIVHWLDPMPIEITDGDSEFCRKEKYENYFGKKIHVSPNDNADVNNRLIYRVWKLPGDKYKQVNMRVVLSELYAKACALDGATNAIIVSKVLKEQRQKYGDKLVKLSWENDKLCFPRYEITDSVAFVEGEPFKYSIDDETRRRICENANGDDTGVVDFSVLDDLYLESLGLLDTVKVQWAEHAEKRKKEKEFKEGRYTGSNVF